MSTSEAPQWETIAIPFGNVYSATGNVQVTGVKELAGRDLVAGEFSFRLLPLTVDGVMLDAVATATNGADGTVDFGVLEYTVDSLRAAQGQGYAVKASDGATDTWTLTYLAVEDDQNLPAGVTVAAGSQQVTVQVVDAGDGVLTAQVVPSPGLPDVPGGSDPQPQDPQDPQTDPQANPQPQGLVFRNVYREAVHYPAGVKLLDAADGLNPPDIAGKYTFALTDVTDPQQPQVLGTATNQADGNVLFDALTFTAQDIPEGETEAVFTYQVTEEGQVAGVQNDANMKTFQLRLHLDDQGSPQVERVGSALTDFAFTNTYAVSPVSSSVQVQKVLDGRPLQEGEFHFRLISADGAVHAEAANDAQGTVAFPATEYTAPGEYRYTVHEIREDAGGVTYDDAVYTVVDTVIDNGAGQLEATTQRFNAAGEAIDSITFTNSYQAQPATVDLIAWKAYLGAGAQLQGDDFTFQLQDENGTVVATAKNSAQGSVVFGPLTFDQAGVYTYTLSEVNDGKDGVTYHEGTYRAVVTVADNGFGLLRAAVDYPDGAPLFTNSITPPPPDDHDDPGNPDDPSQPPHPTPGGSDPGKPSSDNLGTNVPATAKSTVSTGDNLLGFAIALTAASLAAVAAALLARKRLR